jgi:hypothetical protein
MVHSLRNCSPLTAFRFLEPSFRHGEGAIIPVMTLGAGITQEHPHLAVGNLAKGATVLLGYSSRVLPLFDEPGLVHHQDSLRVSHFDHHVLAQVLRCRLVVPTIAIQHPLYSPGVRIAHVFRQLPTILVLHVRYQPSQIVHRVSMGLLPAEVRAQ